MSIYELRNLMEPGTEGYPLPKLNEAELRRLQQMADSFFAKQEVILVQPSGELSRDRLTAMCRICSYLKSCKIWDAEQFASGATFTIPGHMECLHWIPELSSICYDGGSYSENYTEVLHIDIISSQDWEAALDKQRYTGEGESWCWMYKGEQPNDDARVFRMNGNLYLKEAFGTVHNYSFVWHIE